MSLTGRSFGLDALLGDGVSGWVEPGVGTERQSGHAAGVGEYGRLPGGRLRTPWAGWWSWPGGVEHGPDDLAAVGGGQDPERAW